jgi:drug/metabolite transporter (DMT)-like permease
LKRIKAELLLFLTATIWAGTFPIVKVSLQTIPPFYFIGIRFLIAAIIFSIIYYKKFQLNSYEIIKAGLVLGVLQMLGFSSQTIGMIYTTASNSALITGVTILLVPFAQLLLTNKRVYAENLISIIIVFTGLFLLTQPHISGINIGDVITLICAFAWALYIVYVDIYTNKYDIFTLILLQLWFVTICSLIIAFMFEDFSLIRFTAEEIYMFLYMSILATLLTTILLNKYQKETTPIRASIIYTWEQPAAVMLSIIFIKEILTGIQMLGGIIMIAGILFSEIYGYYRKNN